MRLTKALFLLLIAPSLFGQLKPIGSWTDHLPFQRGTAITTDGNILYCGTTTGIFSYNTIDNSINKFSKVNILNDVEIAQLKYSKEFSTLLVVYKNANIDIISNNQTINIPFIKLSGEKKEVYEIKLQKNLAYLSTAFGITVIDLVKKEIVDSYKFGPNGDELKVNSSAILNNRVYAATDEGLYSALLSSNLLDFNSWSINSFNSNNRFLKLFETTNGLAVVSKTPGETEDSLFLFNGSTFTNIPDLSGLEFKSLTTNSKSDLIYNTRNRTLIIDTNLNVKSNFPRNNGNTVGGIVSNQNRVFLINTFHPLVELSSTQGNVILTTKPNGPFEDNIFDLDAKNGQVWAVGGGHDFAYNNAFRNGRIYHLSDGTWESYIDFAEPSLNGIFDILSVTINPEDENQVFFGSWARGMIEYRNQIPFRIYQDTNTNNALKIRLALASDRWIPIGESAFDAEGNLWMTNSFQKNGMAVRKKDGSWKGFDFSNIYSEDETTLYDIAVDQNGYKWIALPKENAIIVYDDRGTIDNTSDDRSIKLTSEVGQGSIPGARGIKIEVDKDGLIWIGTSDGIAVHFNPGGVFDGDRDFDRIIFFDGENNEIVLKNSTVKEIEIDGSNRKWIGTENSGVLLLSEDGKETILEFNEDNSPLLSNSINAITVDNKSGEVYIATSKGLLSYRGTAVDGSENFTNVSIYPNPVRADYTGNIAISGLLDNSTVKITDVSGTLVNELKSEGGQVLWDGNSFDGRRASTGVYLIFLSGEDEEGDLKTEIGKLLFVN